MRAGGVEDAMTRLEQDTPCLCHNDLTAGNLMREGNELVAIDWEYAAMGSRYFDVAIAAECLSSAERVLMVNEVFGAAADEALMNAGDCIASLVTALWEHQYATAQAPDPSTWLNGRCGA
jgi:thiamine kinase-like enzyme